MKKGEKSKRLFKILIFGVVYLMLFSIIPSSGSTSPENAATEYTKAAKSPGSEVSNVRIVYDAKYNTINYTCWTSGTPSYSKWNGTSYNDLNTVQNAGVIRRNTTFNVTATGISSENKIKILGPCDVGESRPNITTWNPQYNSNGPYWNLTVPSSAPVGDYQVYLNNSFCTVYVIFDVFLTKSAMNEMEFSSWAYNESNDADEYGRNEPPANNRLMLLHPFEERTVEFVCSIMGSSATTEYQAAINLYRIANARIVWDGTTSADLNNVTYLLNTGTALTLSDAKKVALQTGHTLPAGMVIDGQCSVYGTFLVGLARAMGIPGRPTYDDGVPWGWNYHDWCELYIDNPDMSLSSADKKWLVFDATDQHSSTTYNYPGESSIDTTHDYYFHSLKLGGQIASTTLITYIWDGVNAPSAVASWAQVDIKPNYTCDESNLPNIDLTSVDYGYFKGELGAGDRDFFNVTVTAGTTVDIGFIEGAAYAQIYVNNTTTTSSTDFAPDAASKTAYYASLVWGDDKCTVNIPAGVNYIYIMVDNAKEFQYANDYAKDPEDITGGDADAVHGMAETHHYILGVGKCPPKVTLKSPNGNEVLIGGKTYNITWNATIINSSRLTTNCINISYSVDGGAWTPIAIGEQNDGYYIWTVPEINSDDVKINITCNTTDGKGGYDVSDSSFTIRSATPFRELSSGNGNATGDRYGWNVSYAGDLNNDSYDDIAVGAPYVTYNSVTGCGAVYIFFGYPSISLGNLTATYANVSIYGTATNGRFGWSLSNAGDVNQTSGGIDDIIIGEPDNNTGVAYIFLGRSSWSSSYTTANANVTLIGEASGDKFGSSVSGAGDVNNDGYDDVIIGAYANSSSKGKAYIYYGPPVDEINYVDSFDETSSGRYGTTSNFVNAQSATDGGAYATLTEEFDIPPKILSFCSYRSNTGTNTLSSPKNRDWDGSAWSVSENEMPTAGSPVRFVRTAYCPIESRRYEKIVVTLSDDGYLDAYVWTGAAWSVTNNIAQVWTTAPTGAQRPYDITYETSSGRALLVYDVVYADATKDLGYKIWTFGTGWSTEYYIDVTGVASTNPSILFVNLASNPNSTSNQTTMIIQDDTNADTFAGIWSGSSWGLFTTLSTAYTIVGREATAIAYSTYYKKILAVSGNGANSMAWKWYVQGAADWSAGTAFDPDSDAGDDVCFITLKPDPAATSTDDYIMLAGVNDLSDLNAWAWDMADATPGRYNIVNEVDDAIDSATARCIDFAWESTGNQGLIVWGTTAGQIHYNTYSISAGWGASWTTYVTMGANIHPWIQLRTNTGSVSGDIKILGAVLEGTVFDLGAIKWDGATFTVIGTSTFTADTTVITFECFELEFQANPKEYLMDIEFKTISVQSALFYELQLNYRTDAATSENFGVLVYNGATWGDLSSQGDLIAITTMTAKTYTLSSAHRLADGSVRVRFVGRSERNDSTQNQLWIEYHRIRSFGMVGSVTLTGENTNDKFGFSVSGAGNVNGDSYDDVLVGAPGYDNGRGKAYVVYGGSSLVSKMGFGTKALLSQYFSSGVPPTGWSKQVFGTTDWISSATTNAGGTSPEAKLMFGGAADEGIARLYSMAIDTTGMTSITFEWKNYHDWYSASYPYWIAIQTSSDASTWHNTTWVYAPTADMAKATINITITTLDVGSSTFYVSFTLGGKSYGINGWYVDDVSLTGVTEPNIARTGESSNDNFGYSVSALGDVNNDGYDDFAVGAPGYDSSKGRAYIYYGSPSIASADIVTITQQPGDNGDHWVGKDTWLDQGNPTFNYGISTGLNVKYSSTDSERLLTWFDVGMYSTDTIITSAKLNFYCYAGTQTDAVTISLYRVTNPWHEGINNGVAATGTPAGATWNNRVGTTAWTTAGGDYDSTAETSISVSSYGWYTWNISSLVQKWVNGTASNYGIILVGNGGVADSAKTFYSADYVTDHSLAPKLELTIRKPADLTISGDKTGDKFGYSVSGKDLNNDSHSDIIVGAPYKDNGTNTDAGAVYVFFGNSTMPSATNATHADNETFGNEKNTTLGFSVSYADLNKDGYNDIIAGAYNYSSDKGKVYVYSTPSGAPPEPDTEKPQISGVNDFPDLQETGGFVNITAVVTDNVGVTSVKVNISGPAGFTPVNVSMTKIPSTNTYYYNVSYSALGTYTYFVWATDASNNQNKSTTNMFLIQDSTKPSITNVQATPIAQIVNGYVNITCNVTDNVAVDKVYINITGPLGFTPVNITMIRVTGTNDYYYNTTYSVKGIYSYYIWANDTSNNQNKSATYQFEIDITKPEITNVQALPSPQEVYGYVNITCTITDNVGANLVKVNVSGPAGFVPLNVTMAKISGTDNYYYNISYSIIGTYYYYIWANDTSNNQNNSISYEFSILDTTKPSISSVQANPETQTPGGYVNISATVTDNYQVAQVWLNITYPDSSSYNFSITQNKTGSTYYCNKTYTMLGWYNYTIWANDSSNNWNSSGVYSFNITGGNQPPNSPSVLGVEGFISGAKLMNITNHTPNLNWTYSDPNGDPQGGYNVTIWNGTTIMWYINSTGTNNNVTYGVGGSAPQPLADGFDYNFTVKVNDSNGAWSILSYLIFHMNTPPPAPTIPVTPSNGETGVSTNTAISWTNLSDNEGSQITYYWYVDVDNPPAFPYNASGSTISNTSGPLSLNPGITYYWWVMANDSYENATYWSLTWNFTTSSENNPPNPPSLTGPENNTWNNSATINFTWSYFDPESNPQNGFNITISNNSDFSVINYTANETSSNKYKELTLSDGTWYWRVKVNDTNGAWSDWSGWRIIKIDTQKPSVTINTPTPSIWYKGTISLNTTITDTGSGLDTVTIKYKIDTGTWTTLPSAGGNWYTTNIDTTTLSGGSHTIYIIANDTVTNSNNTKFVTINVDNTKPNVTINTPTAGWYKGTISLNTTITDPSPSSGLDTSTIKYKIDSGDWVVLPSASGGYYTTSIDTITLSDGSHTIYVIANDSVGNSNNTESVTINVDNTAPVVSSTAPSNGGTTPNVWQNVSFVFNETMNTSIEPTISTNMSGTITYSWESSTKLWVNHSLALNVDSSYYVNISGVKDLTGNPLSGNYKNITFTVTSGVGMVVTAPDGGEYWAGGDTQSIKYELYGGAPPYTVNISYSLNSGAEWIFITWHNQTTTGLKTYSWNVPVENSTNCLIKVEANDSGTPITNSADVSGVFTIDSEKPTSYVNAISPYWWNTSLITVPASASDNFQLKNITLYYAYSSDNGTWPALADYSIAETKSFSGASWSDSFSFPPPSQGYYRFYTRAGDQAGNFQSVPADFQAIVGYDTILPTSTIATPAESSCINYNSIWLNGSCSDTGAGINRVEVSITWKDNGTTYLAWTNASLAANYTWWDYLFNASKGANYTIKIRAIDNASNVGIETMRNISVLLINYFWITPSNSTYTNTQVVELNLSASGIDKIRFKNELYEWREWLSYDETKEWNLIPWTLARGDGLKTVWVEVRKSGVGTTFTRNDTIILDTSLEIISVNPAPGTLKRNLSVNISVTLVGEVNGLDWNNVSMKIDGSAVSYDKAVTADEILIWHNKTDAVDGKSYECYIYLKDNASNVAERTWYFIVDSRPVTQNDIWFSHYNARAGQNIAIFVNVYNNNTAPKQFNVSFWLGTDNISSNKSVTVEGKIFNNTVSDWYALKEGDGVEKTDTLTGVKYREVIFTVKVENETGAVVSQLNVSLAMVSASPPAEPVKSFEATFPAIITTVVVATVTQILRKRKK